MKQKKDIFHLSADELKALQNKTLQNFIQNQLYPFSNYYRRVFDENNIKPTDIKTVEDLAKLPFSSKDDLIQEAGKNSLDFVLRPNPELIKEHLPLPKKLDLLFKKLTRGSEYVQNLLYNEYNPIFMTATTGTTNEPTSFLYTKYDLENLQVYGKRLIEMFGFKKGDRAVNMFPYAPHLAFWQVFMAGYASNIFIVSTGGGKTLGTEGNIHTILRTKPQFILGVPTYVYHVIKQAHEKKLDFSFVHSIILGAGRVPAGYKQKIASLLEDMGAKNISVFGTYGFTEARSAWGECPTSLDVSSGYHLYPDHEIIEIIDPETGEVKGPGEDGEIVYTGIDKRGTCVLRFRTGDLAVGGITYDPCPHCGRTVPRISSDITRASNIKDMQLSKVKGSLVNLNNLELLLDDDTSINEWQIVICKKDDDPYGVDQIHLNVSLNDGIDQNNFGKNLNQKMMSTQDISFNEINILSAKEVEDIIGIESNLKAKKIIDERPKD